MEITTQDLPTSYSGINNLFTRINITGLFSQGFTGKNIHVAFLDDYIRFDPHYLKDKELKVPRVYQPYQFYGPKNHATLMAFIVGANNLGLKYGNKTGIAPGVKIASYSSEIIHYDSIIHARENLGVSIVNISLQGITPRQLRFGFSNVDKSFKQTAVVVIAGNGRQQEPTSMATGLHENYYPEHGNIIVTVALDYRGQLTSKSRKCGKTRLFCVGVPSNGATSTTAPVVTGALALLMEAVPGLEVQKYIQALLKTASHADDPNEETGMGLINVDEAHKWLLNNQER